MNLWSAKLEVLICTHFLNCNSLLTTYIIYELSFHVLMYFSY
jgi:hypothetical protein